MFSLAAWARFPCGRRCFLRYICVWATGEAVRTSLYQPWRTGVKRNWKGAQKIRAWFPPWAQLFCTACLTWHLGDTPPAVKYLPWCVCPTHLRWELFWCISVHQRCAVLWWCPCSGPSVTCKPNTVTVARNLWYEALPLDLLGHKKTCFQWQGFPDPVVVHLFINPSGSSSLSWSPCTLGPASPSARSSADPPSAVGKPSLLPCLEPPDSLIWWP